MLSKVKRTNSKTEYVLYIIAIIISLLYIFTVAQSDMRTITNWGYDLLESVRMGKISDFPAYTNDLRQMPSNYTMLSNMTTALWLSPLYIVQLMAGSTFAIEIYWLWYKCLIGAIHFVNVYLIGRVLKKLNIPERQINVICILYMLSAVVLITVIGQGQIDMICMLFVILGYGFLVDKRYNIAALMMGISVIYKPFSLLLAVPIIILLSGKLKVKTIPAAIILIAPYLVNMIATHFIMPDYGRYVALVNEQSKEIMGSNRVEEIFALRLNSVLVFFGAMLILCFVCYYKSWHNKVKMSDYIILPTIGFLTYAVFVSPAAYWFIIIMPAVLLMGQYFDRRDEFYLLNLGVNLGCMVNVYFSEKQYSPSPELSIIGYLTGKEKDVFFYQLFAKDVVTYIQLIGCTVFVVCVLIIVGMYIYAIKKRGLSGSKPTDISDVAVDVKAVSYGVNTGEPNRTENVLFALQCVPAAVYLLFSYVEFIV